MKQVMVRYKVKADKAEENTNYIKKVFAELEKNERVAGLNYFVRYFLDHSLILKLETYLTFPYQTFSQWISPLV